MKATKFIIFLLLLTLNLSVNAQFTEKNIVFADENYMKKDKKSDWALNNWVLREDIEDAQYTIYWDKEKTEKASFIWKHEGSIIGITHYSKDGLINKAVHFYGPYRALMATKLDSLHYTLRYYNLWEGPKEENIIPNITHTKSYLSGFYKGKFTGYIDYYNIDKELAFTEYYKNDELAVKDYYQNKKLIQRTYDSYIYDYYKTDKLKSVIDTSQRIQTEFYKNGNIKNEGAYFNNKKMGWWKNFNKKEELIDSTNHGNYNFPLSFHKGTYKLKHLKSYPLKDDTLYVAHYGYTISNPKTGCMISDELIQLYKSNADSLLNLINKSLSSIDAGKFESNSEEDYESCFIEKKNEKFIAYKQSFTTNLYNTNASEPDTSTFNEEEEYEERYENTQSAHTNYIDSTLYSMSYSYWNYYGGAHGNFGETPFNFDLTNGKAIYIEGVFKTDSASSSKLLILLKEKIGFETEDFDIGEIGFTEEYIYVYYAPYSIGGWQPVYVYLSYTDIKPFLKQNFIKKHSQYIKKLSSYTSEDLP